jgi:hypothetical protein
MQISTSTLLASQQVGQAQPKPAAGFTQALKKASGFQPLPLKQTASVEAPSPNFMQPTSKQSQKLGFTVDIKI